MISDAAGDARKTTRAGDVDRLADAVQAGDALDGRRPRTPGRRALGAVPSVRMNVGATALTVMPWRPHSTARHLVRCDDGRLATCSRSTRSAARRSPACELRLTIRPRALADHHAARRLAREEEALDVDVDRQVEVGLGDVLGGVLRAEPGVVDEDVEPPEAVDDRVDRRRDLVEVA